MWNRVIKIDEEYSLVNDNALQDAWALLRVNKNGTGFFVDVLFGKGKTYKVRRLRSEVEALEWAEPILEASRKETFDEFVIRIRSQKKLKIEKVKKEIEADEAQLSWNL